jgi:hypothetical protein
MYFREFSCKDSGKMVKLSLQVYRVKTSSLTHFVDNLLTDGGKVVILMRRPRFTPQEDSWYSFLLETVSIPGLWCGWKD